MLHWYDFTVRYQNEQLKDKRFSLVIDRKISLEQLLELISFTSDVNWNEAKEISFMLNKKERRYDDLDIMKTQKRRQYVPDTVSRNRLLNIFITQFKPVRYKFMEKVDMGLCVCTKSLKATRYFYFYSINLFK